MFDSPIEAYDIEFVDHSGRESRFAYSVKPNQLRNAEDKTKAETYEVAEEAARFGAARPTTKTD
jgi:hypothetical protein